MTGARTAPVSKLRIRAHDWDVLHAHLFSGDNDEHGAALLCGRSVVDGVTHFLVREVILAVDGIDYTPGERGHRHLTGAFVTRALRRAKDAGLTYLAVHNHGGVEKVGFSRTDLASHERGYPTLLAVSGVPVGGLVLAKNALAGDIWMTDGTRSEIEMTSVVGNALDIVVDGKGRAQSVAATPQFARQALVFGEAGNQRMSAMTVGIVGAGGIGMMLVQLLARLGVGRFIVIDPDHVSITNLPRLPEARMSDAVGRLGSGWIGRAARLVGLNSPTLKVDLAARIIRKANPPARIIGVAGDVADDDVARQLRSCDFIFLAADAMLARDVVNQLAYQYLIPTLQVGSKVVVDKSTGAVMDIYSVVRSLGTTPGCMRCNGLVNLAKLAEESVATNEQRQNQRYVDEPGIEAPSVVTLNSVSAGWAANDFMLFASGLGRPGEGFRLFRNRPLSAGRPQLVVQTPDIDPMCHVCGDGLHSVLARGDGVDLPTRVAN